MTHVNRSASAEALVQSFTTFKDNVRVVMLNACFPRVKPKRS